MPLAFPGSGNVYSREVMEDLAVRNEGYVTDLRTGESCAYGDLRRVFIS